MHFAQAKGLLSANNHMNVYRGCTHGCIYCDSRSLCYQIMHDFEDIEVKQNAPELLEATLRKRRKLGMIGTGAMTDPYMHCESKIRYTRKCLEIIEKHGFGFTCTTKSARVLEDIDLFKKINAKSKCVIQMTLTTYDEELCRIIEPNVSTTKARFDALCELNKQGIPTIVWFTPILPFINDSEENVRGIIDYCVKAGVKGIIFYGIGTTLRQGNREYFYTQIDKHFHSMSKRYDNLYGDNYIIQSPNDKRLSALFHKLCDEYNIMHNNDDIFAYLHEFEDKNAGEQMTFF